jgi:hypothetical protein
METLMPVTFQMLLYSQFKKNIVVWKLFNLFLEQVMPWFKKNIVVWKLLKSSFTASGFSFKKNIVVWKPYSGTSPSYERASRV